jgi:AraC-like DNA-binding protein
MKSTVAGSLFLWRAAALVIGPGIDSKLHRHFALQLTFGIDGPFRARVADDAKWSETSAAVFAPNQPHQIDGGGMLAHLFLEVPQPHRHGIGSLQADFAGMAEFAAVRAYLQHACRGPSAAADFESATQAARCWRACVMGVQGAQGGTEMPPPDARIERALAAIADASVNAMASQPAANLDARNLAALVHLSESRFTHLFRAQTGLPLSRYLLWSRLLCALEAVAHGANMTLAAHQAGFADLAHMSRTFRETFGVVPSALQKMTIAFKRDPL